MNLLEQIDLQNTPDHIAIIMDGNGRWAQQQGQERLFGHNYGVEAVRESLKAAQEMGVKYLTVYAFSTENWNRPKEEVEGLMNLLVNTITAEVDELDANDVKISTIGNLEELPDGCSTALNDASERTKFNEGVNLILALNYSARWEIVNATKQIASKVKNGELDPEDICDKTMSDYLSTHGLPDPELLIRTSGEHRVSNFLLWQIAYSEFHFTDVLWPDFKKEDMYKAVLDYQSRERRFGMVPEQITK
jgi:undecaprenyl diphosphate synthase